MGIIVCQDSEWESGSGGDLDKYVSWYGNPPIPNDNNYVMYDPPLDFTIEIDADISNYTSLSLIINAREVDYYNSDSITGFPEINEVYINGHYLGVLMGQDEDYRDYIFEVNPDWLYDGTSSNPGINNIEIYVDEMHNGMMDNNGDPYMAFGMEVHLGTIVVEPEYLIKCKIIEVGFENGEYDIRKATKVQLWGDTSPIGKTTSETQIEELLITKDINTTSGNVYFSSDDLNDLVNGWFEWGWIDSDEDIQELYLLDINDDVLGKIGFIYTDKYHEVNRNKEAIVILHTDLAKIAPDQHPDYNEEWKFYNKYKYDYVTYGVNIGVSLPSYLYQMSMLIPPSKSLDNIDNQKQPVVFVHGVTGTDEYWGNSGQDNDALDVFDYYLDSYTAITQSLDTDGLYDIWEYYYPPDQSWRDSGFLLGRDIKRILNKYTSNSLDIIAHSMGGLVTRSYIEGIARTFEQNETPIAIDYSNDVNKVLMLGTPNHGSMGGNKLYFGLFLSSEFSGLLSWKDENAPANRDLAIGSEYLMLLNNKEVGWEPASISQDLVYLVIAGTQRIIDWFDFVDVVELLESIYHEDGIVSISSASLLQYGIPLGLYDGNHTHLNSSYKYKDNANLIQNIPEIIIDFLRNGPLSEEIISNNLISYYNTSEEIQGNFENIDLYRSNMLLKFSSENSDELSFNGNIRLVHEQTSNGPSYIIERTDNYSQYYEIGLFYYKSSNMYFGNDETYKGDINYSVFYPYIIDDCNAIAGIGYFGSEGINSYNFGMYNEQTENRDILQSGMQINNKYSQTLLQSWYLDTCTIIFLNQDEQLINGNVGENPRFVSGSESLITQVDNFVSSVTFLLNYSPNYDIEYTLQTPSGALITKESENNSTIFFQSDSIIANQLFSIYNPEPGEWISLLNGQNSFPDTTFRLTIRVDTDLKLFVYTEEDTVSINNHLQVHAFLSNNNISSLDVSGIIRYENGDESAIIFNDNGQYGDATPNDLIYSTNLKPSNTGFADLIIELRGITDSGYDFSRVKRKTILVTEDSSPKTNGSLKSGGAYFYPNPLVLTKTDKGYFRFSTLSIGNALIKIYDVSNTLVMKIDIKDVEPGIENSISWDGRNGKGNVVSTGIYFYIIELDNGERTMGKIAIVR